MNAAAALVPTCEATAPRQKLTLGWRGKTERLPDIVFVDVTEPVPPPPMPELRIERELAVPPIPPKTAHQEHIENVVRLLDRWAEWMRSDGVVGEGAPSQSTFAPDARIHSFEDMEIEVDKRLVAEMNTAVWDLQVMEREAIMTHYGLKTRGVWQGRFDKIFDQAVESLFGILKSRIAC